MELPDDPAAVAALPVADKLAALRELPARARAAVADLSRERLDTPYREGGWTARQVIHHLADSHLNAFVRAKLALTEDEPELKVWDENAWAALPDSTTAPVAGSLEILDGVHARLVLLLSALDARGFQRAGRHQQRGRVRVADLLDIYAWHGAHHLRQVEGLRRARGW